MDHRPQFLRQLFNCHRQLVVNFVFKRDHGVAFIPGFTGYDSVQFDTCRTFWLCLLPTVVCRMYVFQDSEQPGFNPILLHFKTHLKFERSKISLLNEILCCRPMMGKLVG